MHLALSVRTTNLGVHRPIQYWSELCCIVVVFLCLDGDFVIPKGGQFAGEVCKRHRGAKEKT